MPLAQLMLRNRRLFESQGRVMGAAQRLGGGIARRLRDNSLAGSQRHIHRHYDLGNDFFGLFLDTELHMYLLRPFRVGPRLTGDGADPEG